MRLRERMFESLYVSKIKYTRKLEVNYKTTHAGPDIWKLENWNIWTVENLECVRNSDCRKFRKFRKKFENSKRRKCEETSQLKLGWQKTRRFEKQDSRNQTPRLLRNTDLIIPREQC